MTVLDRGAHRAPRVAPAPGRANVADWVLGAVAVGALGVGVWPVVVMMSAPVRPAGLAVLAPLLAHSAGMLAGYGVVVMLGLMSRSPLLERAVGADRLARWHGLGGRSVVVLVLLHAAAAVVSWQQIRGDGLLLSLWHVERLPWLISATIATALLCSVGIVSARSVRRRVAHETWHTVHLLVYLAAALGFVHQLGGPDLAGHRLLQIVWALLYTLVFAAVLQHRVLHPLRSASRHRMRVAAVRHEGPGVVSIEVEGHALDELRPEAGQFFRWRFLTPDLWRTAHPFSLSAAPTPNRMRLTVKALGNGSGVLQHVEPGTWLVAEGPYGAMTAARRTKADVLLVAGGVGITPMRALLQTMPLAPGQDLLLVYRARSWSDLLFRDEIDEIVRRRPQARVHYLVGDTGPFTPQQLLGLAPNLVERDVYVCGPPGMSVGLRQALRLAGLPGRQLHEERFDL